jgi:hypothetical protein
MTDRLPTVYHGVPTFGADRQIVEDAVQDIIARLNALRGRLTAQVICSIVVSVCCAQDDPAAIFDTIVLNADVAINAILAEREGHS